jgi:N-carbamoylputrescine amidase
MVTVAATQMACSWDLADNLKKAEFLLEEAVRQGAQIILLQELFETPYFCQIEDYEHFKLASIMTENSAILRFQRFAKEHRVVLPISFYEKSGHTAFNTVAVIDADGTILGTYRKTHIPDGQCYEEKFYFSPGDTGFKVWKTRYGNIGIGICWDQWFPESARCMALLGAEILFYPTAIGSEPILKYDSQLHWQRCMQGHAAANIMPVITSNRVGTEKAGTSSMTFYGSSFIVDSMGEVVKQANRLDEAVLVESFDLDRIESIRRSWGVFRDRRPSMYQPLLTMGI